MPRKVLESFNVSYLQILDAEGHLDRDLEPDLSPDATIPQDRAADVEALAERRIARSRNTVGSPSVRPASEAARRRSRAGGRGDSLTGPSPAWKRSFATSLTRSRTTRMTSTTACARIFSK